MPNDLQPEVPPFILLYPLVEQAKRDGSNIFLRRLFEQFHAQYGQIYWDGPKASDSGLIYLHDTIRWPWHTGRGFLMRLLDSMGLTWWKNGQLNEARFNRTLKTLGFQPRFAYVAAYNEYHASIALKVLKALRLPYLFHMMDLSNPEGLDATITPQLCSLVSGAARLIAVSPLILEELRKFTQVPGIVSPCVSFLSIASQRQFSAPFTITISGAIYDGAADSAGPLRHLERILPRLQKLPTRFRFVYLGSHFQKLTPALQKVFENAGFHEDVAPFCLQSHLCILPLHYARDGGFRFSLPSRMSDFLLSGTPVACSCDADTAVDNLVTQHSGKGLFRIASANDLFNLIEGWINNDAAWVEASIAATQLGRDVFSFPAVRESIKEILTTF